MVATTILLKWLCSSEAPGQGTIVFKAMYDAHYMAGDGSRSPVRTVVSLIACWPQKLGPGNVVAVPGRIRAGLRSRCCPAPIQANV